ncbi:hypothetical protein HQN89_35560 [Paenibacillus frigoriresistens]|uniref:hypothetical protein n=1 Tax=Paenibacillus alginolyticus TaxID=59839 RepID=UPI0015631FE9|nr:hypothetical protein [Paenibacillus frigoriresistens]NRF96116.1 hypothetical protein [Paenibacillus frigoriresistens]
MIVTFKLGDTEISAKTTAPSISMDNTGKKVMIINNAITTIEKDTGIDLRKLIDDIYDNAKVVTISD